MDVIDDGYAVVQSLSLNVRLSVLWLLRLAVLGRLGARNRATEMEREEGTSRGALHPAETGVLNKLLVSENQIRYVFICFLL